MQTEHMSLAGIREIFDHDGPFATVYLEARSPSEDSGTQVRLRWEDLRGRLSEQGAGDTLLGAIDDTVLVDDIAEVHSTGRVVVATADAGVLFTAQWDAASGGDDAAYLAELPSLGAYLRERLRVVRILVAIADQQGAVVRRTLAMPQLGLDQHLETQVSGEADEHAIHKPREGALSHNQIQRRADEAVKQNARGVADYLESAAQEWEPHLVVVAGEVQGRTALLDELPQSIGHVSEVDSGGVGDRGAEAALSEAVETLAAELSDQYAHNSTERYREALARGRAVDGREAVAKAAEMGAIDTLLIEYDRTSAGEASILRDSVKTDARIGLVAATVDDAVAAILRFEAPAEMLQSP